MLKKIKSINWRHWLCLGIILGSVALGVFVYQYPFYRLLEGISDFGRIIAYTFADLIELGDRLPFRQTVNDFSAVNLQSEIGIDLAEIVRKLTELKDHIWVGQNFLQYLIFLLYHLTRFLYYLSIALIVILILAIPVAITWDDINNDYGQDTKSLRGWKRWIVRPWRHVVDWLWDFWDFFRSSRWWTAFLAIWLLYLGVYTLVLEFLAYYFYILNFLDFSTLGRQCLKLVVDMLLTWHVLPGICWAALFIWLFDKWRQHKGMDRLQHMEARNKGMLEEAPQATFFAAPMRAGKDMAQTDMTITRAAMDRKEYLTILNENQEKFPRFPWITFELTIKDRIHDGTIKHWVSARNWVRVQRLTYAFTQKPELIWHYDVEQYATEFDDNLKIISIWDALEEYVQAYFSYTMTTSYILANLPIRDDFIIEDEGNFPLVDVDFFHRDPARIHIEGKYCHILDYDMLRPGRKILKDNPNVGAFEFGVLSVTEIDKERKNMDQLKEVKAREDECNQKNDMFNTWFKMSGQPAMLANRCFMHVFCNAQRVSSWGADGHELCQIMHIEKHKETNTALPLFWIEECILGAYVKWWRGVWNESRLRWGNNHLITWLGQGIQAVLTRYLLRRRNLYGYYQQNILCETTTVANVQAGKESKDVEEKKYFIMFKKAYAERYATDYFKAFAELQTARCKVGLNDIPTYRDKYASVPEMKKAHSFLNRDLFTYYNVDADKPEPIDPLMQTDENLDPDDFKYYTEIRPAQQKLARALREYLERKKKR
ncbi:MAG: hypothetical protein IJY50_03650 [Clostridia bacterium]|nr:hypothetical protein [Clostridia bacterium]